MTWDLSVLAVLHSLPHLPVPGALLLAFGLTLLSAHLSHVLVARPVMRLTHRITGRRPVSVVPQAEHST